MAGAYSAVVSVMTVMDNLKFHPNPPLSLDPQQAEALSQHLKFLEEFLESYDQTLPYSTKADPFESRIADAAYAAEDAIESHIVDRCESSNTDAESEAQHLLFLIKFLRSYDQNPPYSTEADPSESRIADGADAIESHIVSRITSSGEGSSAAHDAIESHIGDRILSDGEGSDAAEDAIESHIVDRHTSSDGEGSSAAHAADDDNKSRGWFRRMCCGVGHSKKNTPTRDHLFCHTAALGKGIISSDASLYEALEKVIQEMALIQKEAIAIKQTMAVGVQHQPMPLYSFRSSSVAEKRSMVGADDLLLQMKEKLVSDWRDLQTISVVGMGGTGKTTLAINIYQDRLIKEHFDIRAWATISQQYSIREILVEVLRGLIKDVDKHLSEDALGEILYKHLFSRRYLIVMDDMWSIRAWDGIMRFLPDRRNGSRIVVTTRLSNLASGLPNSSSLQMKLLDENSSWDLLSKIVFGEEGGCPLELEEIGKEIGKSCKGLPLSIIVVGGFLAKSKRTRKVWKKIEENLSVIANLKDYERCLKTLYMSYRQQPIYLKPCFLYMGVFPEDRVIKISTLVKLWVAEGFLKPISGESTPEDIASLYLKDLADRNLILIDAMGITGNIKSCKLHDLLRDLCLREAEKERFYTLTRQGMVHGHRRIVINNTASKKELIKALPSMSPVRSLFWNIEGEGPPTPNLRLLRIFHSPLYGCTKMVESVYQLVNSRFLQFLGPPVSAFPLSIWKFWNLQTLIVSGFSIGGVNAPTDIWYMPHIRHLLFHDGIHLPDPPKDQDGIVLGNLQTLTGAINFSDQVVTRIPNLRKLKTDIAWGSLDKLTNLNRLEKLESLDYSFFLPSQITFPDSLKKLCVRSGYWEQELLDKIGSLPVLEKLELRYWRFEDGKWETTEGQFRSLKFLKLDGCQNMQVWTIESTHFPCLSRLCLTRIRDLEEFPLDLAEVSPLRLIEVEDCTHSAVVSLKRILEENEELNGEADLKVQIEFWGTEEEIHESKTTLEGLTGPNFHIEWKERHQSISRGTQENRVNMCCVERDFYHLMRLKFPS